MGRTNKDENGNTKVTYFNSWDNMNEFIKFSKGPATGFEGDRSSLSQDHGEEWCSGLTLQGAYDLIEKGWPEGTDKIYQLTAELFPDRSGWTKEDVLDREVAGAVLDVGAYLSGEPECFLEFTEIEAKRPVVKVGVPLSISCGYGADTLIRKGVAMLALIDTLEGQRIPTEVWALEFSSGRGGKTMLQQVKIKASEEPFDIDKLCFPVAHPAFFRKIMFASMENLEPQVRSEMGIYSGGGYGRPETYLHQEYDILPDYAPDFFEDRKNCLTWIKENCEKVGVKLEEEVRVV